MLFKQKSALQCGTNQAGLERTPFEEERKVGLEQEEVDIRMKLKFTRNRGEY